MKKRKKKFLEADVSWSIVILFVAAMVLWAFSGCSDGSRFAVSCYSQDGINFLVTISTTAPAGREVQETLKKYVSQIATSIDFKDVHQRFYSLNNKYATYHTGEYNQVIYTFQSSAGKIKVDVVSSTKIPSKLMIYKQCTPFITVMDESSAVDARFVFDKMSDELSLWLWEILPNKHQLQTVFTPT